MLKIWGRLSSVNVQKVVWAAGELGVPFERLDAGLSFGVVDTPDYRAKNPNGLVPCIEDDGLVLWESNAIVRYLAARHGAKHPALWPTDPGQRGLIDRWMDWQTTTFYPPLGPAFMGLVRTPPEKRDAAAIAASAAAFETKIAILDAHLEGRDFIETGAFTIGDIPVGAIAHRWLNMPVERKPRPNVERWYRRLMERPAARAALPLPIA